MANDKNPALAVLRAALQEATPIGCSGDGYISNSATEPPPFRATLALSRQRDLFTRFIDASGVDLTSNHDAAEVGSQLRALISGIYTHVGDACNELSGACEGLELFVSLVEHSHLTVVDASQVCGLLHPLIDQLTRASRAVAELL